MVSVRRPDGNPIELPLRELARRVAWYAVADEVLVRRLEAHDVAEDVVVRACGVEHVVAVQVLGIERAVALGAAAAEIAPGKDRHRGAEDSLAERQVGHRSDPGRHQ